MLEIGLYNFHSKIISFNILSLTNKKGHVTDLTLGDPSLKSEIVKILLFRGILGSESFIFLRPMSWL